MKTSLALLMLLPLTLGALPADISFLVVDLKYSEEKGVTVCNLQPGLIGDYQGHDVICPHSDSIPYVFSSHLDQLQLPTWVSNQSALFDFLPRFALLAQKNPNWTMVTSIEDLKKDPLFIEKSAEYVENDSLLTEYHGIFLGILNKSQASHFSTYYPGILVLNAPFCRVGQDNVSVNKMLKGLKNKWKVYPKTLSERLIKAILADFNEQFLVIKPSNSGPPEEEIILDRKELSTTLESIFTTPEKQLKKHPDPAYASWAFNKDTTFIIEAYSPSDPISLPHAKDKRYDPTIRAAILLTATNDKTALKLLTLFMMLPEKSIDEPGTLAQRHSPHQSSNNLSYQEVEHKTTQQLYVELREALLPIYTTCLASW